MPKLEQLNDQLSAFIPRFIPTTTAHSRQHILTQPFFLKGILKRFAIAMYQLSLQLLRGKGSLARPSILEAYAEAQLVLGRRMYAAGIDDGQLGRRISQLEEKISQIKTNQEWLVVLKAKRDHLLRLLAELALEDDAPLPGAEVEYAHARHIKTLLNAVKARLLLTV